MKIGNYIQAKLSRFNFSMSDEELDAFLVDLEMTASSEYTPADALKIKKVLIAVIPELLISPEIKQGDFTIKYNVDGIKAYYSLLCKEVGIPDIFNPSNDIVRDVSFLW